MDDDDCSDDNDDNDDGSNDDDDDDDWMSHEIVKSWHMEQMGDIKPTYTFQTNKIKWEMFTLSLFFPHTYIGMSLRLACNMCSDNLGGDKNYIFSALIYV